MADIQRTIADQLSKLPLNTSADIGPQDHRDQVVTMRGSSGQIFVPRSASATVTIPDTTNFVEVTAPAWALSSGAFRFDESTNGRLRHLGAVPALVLVLAQVSYTCADDANVIRWRLSKNNTTDEASEIEQKLILGADVVTAALSLMTTLDTNDYTSLHVRNFSQIQDVVINVASLRAITLPI